MKPKLLVTASTFPRYANDTEPRFILDLAKSLLPYFDVTVLAPGGPSLAARERMEGVTVIRFHYFPIRRWETLCYPGAIIGRIREKKARILLVPFLLLAEWITLCRISKRYDIVNAHWVIPQGILQSFIRRPFVVTCHGDDILRLNQAPIRAAKIRALRRSRGIIAISRTLADKIHEWLPDREIHIQSMGCDCSQFSRNVSPTTLLTPFDGITVLFVGRLVRSKGTESLIRAVQNNPQFRLVIVGDGPIADELKEIAKPLGERVIFLGSRDHTELPGIYTASDIFCIPSLSEGLGLVTLEAMASGVCVMGSRVGGIPEIIRHEENGLLFAPGSVEELSVTLLRLAEDPDLRRRLADASFETVRRYDYSLVGAKYASILQDAMQTERIS